MSNAPTPTPHDEKIEAALLGSIIRDPVIMDEVIATIGVNDFYFDSHQRIFRIMLDLYGSQQPVDLATIHDRAQKSGQLKDIGGDIYIVDLFEAVPTAANFSYYTKRIRELSIIRSLIHELNVVLSNAYGRVDSAEGLLADAQKRILAIGEQAVAPPAPLSEVLIEVMDRIDKAVVSHDTGLSTGINSLDQLLGGGFHAGEMIVLAARPSVGKSALATKFATSAAKAGESVLFVSLEMSRHEQAQRILVNESGIYNRRVREARLNSEDVAQLLDAQTRLHDLKMRFVDDPGITPMTLAAICRRMKRRHGLGLMILDYLQLMNPDDRRAFRAEQVASMSRSMKLIAGELGIPVIVLSQLNRASESEGNRRPRLSDLRESGAIEQDADVVMFLHRPEEARSDPEKLELIVQKQRQGRCGIIVLSFQGSLFKFDEVIPE